MKIEFEELTICEVKVFYEQITTQIKDIKDKFVIDMQDVEKVDLCGFQVFISLKKYCDTKDIELKFENIKSSTLQQSIKTYNLENLFGMVA